jgi:hypothetical protein
VQDNAPDLILNYLEFGTNHEPYMVHGMVQRVRVEDTKMVAYEYYWRNEIRGYDLLGVLPERRRNSGRVTPKSIIALGKKFWGDDMDVDNILFIRIFIDKMTGEIYRPKPYLGFDFEGYESGVRTGTTF